MDPAANGNGHPQPEPVVTGNKMAPAMHVQPGPITTKVNRLPDGNVVLHIEHTTGATILPMLNAFAKQLIAQLQEATGGIVVPPS